MGILLVERLGRITIKPLQRTWKKYHLQPHRLEHFKFSTDPEFVGKVRDIVGLYLNPPANLHFSRVTDF